MSDRTGEAGAEAGGVGGLYRRHADWLVTRLRGRFGDEAEDLAQEAWGRLIRTYVADGEVRHPRALLLTIATRLGYNHGRRRKRDGAEVSGFEAMSGSAVSGGQDLGLLVEEIILGLPEPVRDVFVLSRLGGLTHAQIAERLGVSPKTVEWRMTKALAHCAAQLRR